MDRRWTERWRIIRVMVVMALCAVIWVSFARSAPPDGRAAVSAHDEREMVAYLALGVGVPLLGWALSRRWWRAAGLTLGLALAVGVGALTALPLAVVHIIYSGTTFYFVVGLLYAGSRWLAGHRGVGRRVA